MSIAHLTQILRSLSDADLTRLRLACVREDARRKRIRAKNSAWTSTTGLEALLEASVAMKKKEKR